MIDINFIINEIDNGKTLKQISLALDKKPGYVSNYLKAKNIKLPNLNILKI